MGVSLAGELESGHSQAAGVLDMAAFEHDLQALNNPANDIAGNPGSAHRTLIRREAGVNDPPREQDI